MNKLTRRDFLKLTGAVSFSVLTPQFLHQPVYQSTTGAQQNILIVIFDALSAKNIPFYGYSRDTMPNLSRLLDKAIVYHSNFAAGNFTTSGTASLLTGTFPWKHRALQNNGIVLDEYIHRNIFSVLPNYYRVAYSHNLFATTLLKQFSQDLEKYIPRERLLLEFNNLASFLFANDPDIASVSWIRALDQKADGYSYSLFASRFYEIINELKDIKLEKISQNFPLGLPTTLEERYILETAIDYVIDNLNSWQTPFFGYFHFYPPHHPYNTRKEFYNRFENDGFEPVLVTDHVFAEDYSADELVNYRQRYDEFICYADAEFARLYNYLDQSGRLDNTWLILTSDHGEIFNYGIRGHDTPLMYQPLLQVPLVIFEPGRKARLDVYDNTSGVDLLPTLLQINGQAVPDWVDGEVLPPFSNPPKPDRDIFAIEAKKTLVDEPIEKGTIVLVQDKLKMIYYFGYEELGAAKELVELYNLELDPTEMNNLYSESSDLAQKMLESIKSNLHENNQRYL